MAQQPGDRVIPMTPLRRMVAEHMVYSKRTSPHVGTVAEIDMAGVVRLRDRNKRAFRDAHGFSLSFLPFLVHATVRALVEYPRLNASVVDDASHDPTFTPPKARDGGAELLMVPVAAANPGLEGTRWVTTLDLVNSVQMAFTNTTAGDLSISLLAGDRSDAPVVVGIVAEVVDHTTVRLPDLPGE